MAAITVDGSGRNGIRQPAAYRMLGHASSLWFAVRANQSPSYRVVERLGAAYSLQ
jgi:hypothetical protein